MHEQWKDRARHLRALTLVEGLHELIDALSVSGLNQARLAEIFGVNVLQCNEMYLFILDSPSVQIGDFVNQYLCVGQQGLKHSVRNLNLLPSEGSVARPRRSNDILGGALVRHPHPKLETSLGV